MQREHVAECLPPADEDVLQVMDAVEGDKPRLSPMLLKGSRVQGLGLVFGFRVQGLWLGFGFRVQGLGFK